MSTHVNTDDNTLIRYVINGISNSSQNKCLLYDYINLHDFKQKLKVYEEIRRHMKKYSTKN